MSTMRAFFDTFSKHVDDVDMRTHFHSGENGLLFRRCNHTLGCHRFDTQTHRKPWGWSTEDKVNPLILSYTKS